MGKRPHQVRHPAPRQHSVSSAGYHPGAGWAVIGLGTCVESAEAQASVRLPGLSTWWLCDCSTHPQVVRTLMRDELSLSAGWAMRVSAQGWDWLGVGPCRDWFSCHLRSLILCHLRSLILFALRALIAGGTEGNSLIPRRCNRGGEPLFKCLRVLNSFSL